MKISVAEGADVRTPVTTGAPTSVGRTLAMLGLRRAEQTEAASVDARP